MKKWIKAVVFSLALILVIPVTVSQWDQIVVEAATKKPKLNITKKTISEGDSFNLKIKGTKKKVKWLSSNKQVATVTSKGVVKGIDGGSNKKTCKITAKVDGKKYVCKVTVKGSCLNVESLSFEEGESKELWVIGNKQAVTWSSEDENIASVSNGVVTGKSAGTTHIIASTDTKTYKCTITITKKILITDISVQDALNLRVGQSATISTTPIPTNTTEQFTPNYMSNNTNIVSVSQNGMVTALSSGQTQIIVSFKDIRKTVNITVQKTKSELLQEENDRYQAEKQSLESEYKQGVTVFNNQLDSLIAYGGYYNGAEYDYQKELSEANQELTKCQLRVTLYSGDDSDEGKSRLRKAQSDLIDAQNKVNDIMTKLDRIIQINTLKETIRSMESNYQTKLSEIEQKHQQNLTAIRESE